MTAPRGRPVGGHSYKRTKSTECLTPGMPLRSCLGREGWERDKKRTLPTEAVAGGRPRRRGYELRRRTRASAPPPPRQPPGKGTKACRHSRVPPKARGRSVATGRERRGSRLQPRRRPRPKPRLAATQHRSNGTAVPGGAYTDPPPARRRRKSYGWKQWTHRFAVRPKGEARRRARPMPGAQHARTATE